MRPAILELIEIAGLIIYANQQLINISLFAC